MSAWQLGHSATLVPRMLEEEPRPTTLLTFVGRVLTWIPADVVALYAAAITAVADEPQGATGKWLVVGGACLALVAVPLGAFSANSGITKKVKVRMVLAPIAFVIWSPTVPASGWNDIGFVVAHPGWTVVICAVAGFLFAQVAEGIDKRTT